MSQSFSAWLQSRLYVHGYRLAVDGVVGPVTRKKIREFQAAEGLKVTGTATPGTVAALREEPDGTVGKPAGVTVQVPWLEEARRRMGLHEVRDHGVLSRWLRSDGRTLGDPAKLPWCGDFVETCIRLALPDEPIPANPYLARNWLKFGRSTSGRLGAVAVFWRGSRSGTSGHVALYIGEDATAYHVLGGNQSNAVTETRIAKSRLLGFRWPFTYQADTNAIARAANGTISINEA